MDLAETSTDMDLGDTSDVNHLKRVLDEVLELEAEKDKAEKRPKATNEKAEKTLIAEMKAEIERMRKAITEMKAENESLTARKALAELKSSSNQSSSPVQGKGVHPLVDSCNCVVQ